ncbi:chemotaxis protein CheA, partial [Flavobacterium sp. IR1]
TPDDLSIVGEVFRSAHTLKGMAATMGFEDLAHLTHNMENVLDLIRNQKLSVTSEVMDVVFLAVDDLEAMVQDIASGGEGKRDVSAVVSKLEAIEKGESLEAASLAEKETAASTATAAAANVQLTEVYDEFERTVL